MALWAMVYPDTDASGRSVLPLLRLGRAAAMLGMVSLMTAEAVGELGLKAGDKAVCVVEAANVIVETPTWRETRA